MSYDETPRVTAAKRWHNKHAKTVVALYWRTSRLGCSEALSVINAALPNGCTATAVRLRPMWNFDMRIGSEMFNVSFTTKGGKVTIR